MKKRATALLLAVSLVLSLAGCGMFNKAYLSVTKYEDAANASTSETVEASDYAGIINAVETFVRQHRTIGKLKISNYDGTLQTDLTQACTEVKAQYPLAAYAVSYMSTDLSRSASAYDATVYIVYRHTQNEIDAVRYLSDKSALPAAMDETLTALGTYTAFKLISPSVTADDVRAAAVSAFQSDPAACIVQPEVSVQVYPESGSLRFVEVELAYGWRTSELQKMKSTMLGRISQITDGIGDVGDARYALAVCDELSQSCTYTPAGSDALASTAYGALVNGTADSRGFALAFAALCRKNSIECHVVDGTLNGEQHDWNIVLLGGAYYHVDLSMETANGISNVFMRTDREMQRQKYSWDTSAYPACATARNADAIG